VTRLTPQIDEKTLIAMANAIKERLKRDNIKCNIYTEDVQAAMQALEASGLYWIAPVEPSEEMLKASNIHKYGDDSELYDSIMEENKLIYSAMRHAHTGRKG
jgi:hypothetical protein